MGAILPVRLISPIAGHAAVVRVNIRKLSPWTAAIALTGWLAALFTPFVPGTWWLVAVQPLLTKYHSTRFSFDPISPLPIAGKSWVIFPWIPSLFLHGTFSLAGTTGLSILGGCVGAAYLLIAYRVTRVVCASWLGVGALLLLFPLYGQMVLQAQLFAQLLFALLLLVLWTGRWWCAPAIVVAWANIHGSLPIPLLLCGCAAAGVLGVPDHAKLAQFWFHGDAKYVCSAASGTSRG